MGRFNGQRGSIGPRRQLRLMLAGLALCALYACAGPPKRSVIDPEASRPRPSPRATPRPATPSTSSESPPAPADAPVGGSTPSHSTTRDGLVTSAQAYLGVPYRFGGADPRGFDCSGLVQTVFRENGVDVPRTCAQQMRAGRSVELAKARPGDLLFFGKGGRPGHVGIYLGDGRFVHASTGRGKVRTDDLGANYFKRRFLGARTLLGR